MAGGAFAGEDDRFPHSTHEGVTTVVEVGGVCHYHLETVHLGMGIESRGLDQHGRKERVETGRCDVCLCVCMCVHVCTCVCVGSGK